MTVALVFPGIGGDYPGMAHELRACLPVFEASVARTVRAAHESGVSVEAYLAPRSGSSAPVDEPVDLRWIAARARQQGTRQFDGFSLVERHLAVLAVQLGIADALLAGGVRPDVVLGHSLGEWAAATVGGAFDRADVVSLVACRARLMANERGSRTIAIVAGRLEVERLLRGSGMSLAAENSPSSCVVSGPEEAADSLVVRLQDANLLHAELPSAGLVHSPLLRDRSSALRAALARAVQRPFDIPMISGSTGTWMASSPGSEHWIAQLSRPVEFRAALQTLGGACTTAVEVGPGSVRLWAREVCPGISCVRTVPSAFERISAMDVFGEALATLGRAA